MHTNHPLVIPATGPVTTTDGRKLRTVALSHFARWLDSDLTDRGYVAQRRLDRAIRDNCLVCVRPTLADGSDGGVLSTRSEANGWAYDLADRVCIVDPYTADGSEIVVDGVDLRVFWVDGPGRPSASSTVGVGT